MLGFLRTRRKAETKTPGQLAVDRLRWVLAHDRAECWGDRAVRLARKATDSKMPAEGRPGPRTESAPTALVPPAPAQGEVWPRPVVTAAAKSASAGVTPKPVDQAPVAKEKAAGQPQAAPGPATTEVAATTMTSAVAKPSIPEKPPDKPPDRLPGKPQDGPTAAAAPAEAGLTLPSNPARTDKMVSKNPAPPKSLGTFGGVPTPAWDIPKQGGAGHKNQASSARPSSLVTKPMDGLTRTIISSARPLDTLVKPTISPSKTAESFAKSITMAPPAAPAPAKSPPNVGKAGPAAPEPPPSAKTVRPAAASKKQPRKSAPVLLFPGGKDDKKRE